MSEATMPNVLPEGAWGEGTQMRWSPQGYEDMLGAVSVADIPARRVERAVKMAETATPIQRRLIAQALWDVESNRVEGKYFGAGKEFGPVLFTRDLALSGVLGLNRLYPQIMRTSLRVDREARFTAGWNVSSTSSLDRVEGWPVRQTGLDWDGFIRKYRTADIGRRTDDVVWIWSYADLLEKTAAGDDEWAWLYETAQRSFREFYDIFYDPADGLYRGQACFADTMMCGYPTQDAPEDPRDHKNFWIGHVDVREDPSRWDFGRAPASLHYCVTLKAASTNCLTLIALRVMAATATRLGKPEESRRWQERAAALRAGIRRELLLPSGQLAYYKDRDGVVNPRLNPLSAAFGGQAGVFEPGEEAQGLSCPVHRWGVPLLEPFYEDNPHVYHNRTCWPYTDGLLMQARVRLDKDPAPARQAWLDLTARACRDERGFRELTEAYTGRLIGSDHQLWTAAAFLGAAMANGLMEP
jgi:hypothetical protein